MREHLNIVFGERAISSNILYEIKSLQYLFIKSCAMGYTFKNLLKRFNVRVKKKLPHKAIFTGEVKEEIKAYLTEANTKLGMQFYEGCDLKMYSKNYKGNNVWITKLKSIEKRPLGILILWDRVLQTITDVVVYFWADFVVLFFVLKNPHPPSVLLPYL